MIVSERAPARALGVVLRTPVGAEDEERLRLARIGAARARSCRASAPGSARGRHDLVDLVERRHRRGGRGGEHAQEAADAAGASRGRGGGCPRTSGDPEPAVVLTAGREPGREQVHELHECGPILAERPDRHPLLGAVVAVASRARTPRRACPPRGTRSRRRRRRGRRRAARWWARPRARSPRRAPARRGRRAATIAGLAVEDLHHVHVGQVLDRGPDRLVVLAGQVADVDVDHAEVRHLVHARRRRRCGRG